MRISDWSSGVCSSDLPEDLAAGRGGFLEPRQEREAEAERRAVIPLRALALDLVQRPQRQPAARQRIVQRGMPDRDRISVRSEEHTSELQSLMRNSYAVFCLKKKKKQ